MRRLRGIIVAASAAFVLVSATTVSAQTDTQVWANVTLEWIKNHAWTFGVDVEPKVLVSKPTDQPGWATVDVTPSLEYTHGNWLDAIGELHLARTRQTDHQTSTEFAPRVGLRFHLLSNVRDDLLKEKQPKRRLVLRNLVRLDWRNLSYSDDTPPSSTVRLRDRIELEFPLNRVRMTDDGVIYALSDAEWFWTHTDPAERFANKQRVRGGVGRRWSYAWRAEILAIWDRSRDSADHGFTTADVAVDVRLKRVW